MTEGWPDHIELFPRLTRVAKFVGKLLPMHQLSTISDHKFPHPFEDEGLAYTGEPTQEVAAVDRFK